MRATAFLAVLFIVVAGATALGAVILAGVVPGGPFTANPTLHAALGLGWLLGLWAGFAVFLVFLAAWLVEGLHEESKAAARDARPQQRLAA
jgi:hypothetical protein